MLFDLSNTAHEPSNDEWNIATGEKSEPCLEPKVAGWEEHTLPLCYAFVPVPVGSAAGEQVDPWGLRGERRHELLPHQGQPQTHRVQEQHTKWVAREEQDRWSRY